MSLVSGSSTEGVYSGKTYFTSAQSGTFGIGCVETAAPNFRTIVPKGVCTSGASLPSHPTVTVHASEPPVIAVTTVPTTAIPATRAAPWFTARVRLVTASTHRGLGDRVLVVCSANFYCGGTSDHPSGVPTSVTTDSQCYATVKMPFYATAEDAVAALAPGPRTNVYPPARIAAPWLTIAAASVDPQIRTWVSSGGLATARIGGTATISGSAGPCVTFSKTSTPLLQRRDSGCSGLAWARVADA